MLANHTIRREVVGGNKWASSLTQRKGEGMREREQRKKNEELLEMEGTFSKSKD